MQGVYFPAKLSFMHILKWKRLTWLGRLAYEFFIRKKFLAQSPWKARRNARRLLKEETQQIPWGRTGEHTSLTLDKAGGDCWQWLLRGHPVSPQLPKQCPGAANIFWRHNRFLVLSSTHSDGPSNFEPRFEWRGCGFLRAPPEGVTWRHPVLSVLRPA